MGSFFAGVKAGTLAGVLFVGGIAIFNVLLLYALKPTVISVITQGNPAACPLVAVNGSSAQECFSSVVAVDVPFRAFVAFFIALFYTGIFGVYYDALPGKSWFWKGEAMAVIIGANLIFFGYGGYVFDVYSAEATTAFLVVWTPIFGYYVGKLYKKYTRLVEFASDDGELLRVMVDGRDMTGTVRTLAHTSNHKIRAELASDASFREWEASGGVTIEDPRSFETVMEVSGDGRLKASVSKKY